MQDLAVPMKSAAANWRAFSLRRAGRTTSNTPRVRKVTALTRAVSIDATGVICLQKTTRSVGTLRQAELGTVGRQHRIALNEFVLRQGKVPGHGGHVAIRQ